MKKIYLLVLALIAMIAALFGYVAPTAISAANDLAVFFGFGVIALCLPIIFTIVKQLYLEIKNHVS